jgi:8-oxo-dGTP pyrophosphatase MutT (NUDIX family)
MKILRIGEQIKPIPDKARAIIVSSSGDIAINDYGGCLMFPGGKLNSGEDSVTAVTREVQEELGINIGNFQKLFTFQLTAKDYPERDGSISPYRLVETDYFLSRIPEIKFGERRITEKEQIGGLALRIVKHDALLHFIGNHRTNNVRWPYFKEEITIASRWLLEMLNIDCKEK